MRLRTLVGAGLGVCLCLQAPMRAQAHDDGLDAALKLPLTPASVALLVLHMTAPAAQQRLATALKDPRAEVRAVAARVLFVGRIGELTPQLLAALDAEQDAGAGVEEIRAAVLLGGATADGQVLAAASRLGDPAQRAYKTSLLRMRPDSTERAATQFPLPATPPPLDTPEKPRARTLPAFSAALLPDLLKSTGCDIGSLDKTAAEIRYDAIGRPTRVAVLTDHMTPSCDTALRSAAALTVARDQEEHPAVAVDNVFFGIDPALAACAATAGALAPGLAPIGGAGTSPHIYAAPQVKHEEKPEYTRGALDRHVEGTVWLLAIITVPGCVLDESVIRPLDPELDVQALRAVARWTFRPASLDAQPIANGVVIEVSFTMKKK